MIKLVGLPVSIEINDHCLCIKPQCSYPKFTKDDIRGRITWERKKIEKIQLVAPIQSSSLISTCDTTISVVGDPILDLTSESTISVIGEPIGESN